MTFIWSQDCCEAEEIATNNCGGLGCYIPQCTENCEWGPMQCWSSTGYCWCVDENGVEIEGTSLPSWQGYPDCEEFSSQIGGECELENGDNGFYDCDLCCWDTNLLSWLGDEYCDQFGGCAWEGPQFNCEELSFDCGDCNDNWDGSNPSGFCSDDPPILGDINNDTLINVLDIVLLVSFILESDFPSEADFFSGDYNEDGELNVLDVVGIVNYVLDN